MKHATLRDKPRKKKTKKAKILARKEESPSKLIHPRSEYDPEFHPIDYVTHCKEGHSLAEVCSAWNIPRKMLYQWVEDFADFRDAVHLGADCYEGYWSQLMRGISTNTHKGNVAGVIFTQKAQCGLIEGGRSPHRELTGDSGVELDLDLEGKES